MRDFWQGLDAYDATSEFRACAEHIDNGLKRMKESLLDTAFTDAPDTKAGLELIEESLRYGADALRELSTLAALDSPADSSWMSWWATLSPNAVPSLNDK